MWIYFIICHYVQTGDNAFCIEPHWRHITKSYSTYCTWRTSGTLKYIKFNFLVTQEKVNKVLELMRISEWNLRGREKNICDVFRAERQNVYCYLYDFKEMEFRSPFPLLINSQVPSRSLDSLQFLLCVWISMLCFSVLVTIYTYYTLSEYQI